MNNKRTIWTIRRAISLIGAAAILGAIIYVMFPDSTGERNLETKAQTNAQNLETKAQTASKLANTTAANHKTKKSPQNLETDLKTSEKSHIAARANLHTATSAKSQYEQLKEESKEISVFDVLSDENIKSHQLNESSAPAAPHSATHQPQQPAHSAVSQQPAHSAVSQQPAHSAVHQPVAKLAIIIDDVATPKQAQQILKIKRSGIFLTPSFMPPSPAHAHTPELAKDFGEDFMLHLPLEALSFAHAEPDTLLASDSCEKITKRVNEMFKRFKNLKIINNHTGSKFTANTRAMSCLLDAVHARGGLFIDSRTNAQTVVPQLLRAQNRAYIARDVFLDNDSEHIGQQFHSACNIARKKGKAIAIAHPKSLAAIAKLPTCSGVKFVSVREIVSD